MPAARDLQHTHLAELSIRDFAIIDRLRIELAPGFNVLTGETGAGKSIIIDALGAALGDRTESVWLRAGADRASVEALFALGVASGEVAAALEEIGCDVEDEALILSRDLTPSRSVSRVNGRALPVSGMQQLAEQLVDLHSQASHLSLLRVREHLTLLDRFAQVGELRAEMAQRARALHELRAEIVRLAERSREVEREIALLRHEVEEIDAAAVEEEEEQQLTARRSRLQNALRLRQLATDAHDALQGGDEGQGALELLGVVAERVEEIRALDPTLEVDADRLVEALDAAEEAARVLRRYGDAVEEDPTTLDALEERLLAIGDLKRKYGPTMADVRAYRVQAAARVDDFAHRDERLEELRTDEVRAVRAAVDAAVRLAERRAAAARNLEGLVERELVDLGMAGARFAVALTHQPALDGLPLPNQPAPVAYDETGADRVEFLIAPNAGEPPRPLARIASGGELARFMLALKSVLAGADATPVLIFDELDQGVGGRMGHVIGEKLWRLSQSHQVLCITHLPQVAAYADAHYVVRKGISDGRTTTAVDPVVGDARIAELALMLAGAQAGPAAQRSAEEILQSAAEWKEAQVS
ncbi:MAG: repair protein RecN [Chloroflexota bacterium]|jgi:DNA repair protein RecN (Recombination protein N)|nr:repair protein RecN [Chloroflexota bacterium]